MSIKIHLLADSFGRPLQIVIAAGQSSDLAPACDMIGNQTAHYVLADRAHDAGYFRNAITVIEAEPVIHNHQHYRARNQIERLVSRLKRFRRIATPYDRRASTSFQPSNSSPRSSGCRHMSKRSLLLHLNLVAGHALLQKVLELAVHGAGDLGQCELRMILHPSEGAAVQAELHRLQLDRWRRPRAAWCQGPDS